MMISQISSNTCEKSPKKTGPFHLCKLEVVGIDPVGSILAVPDSMNDHKRLEAYQVEGIGYAKAFL